LGNKAGFNDSIEERRTTRQVSIRGVTWMRHVALQSVQIGASIDGSAWLRLYRKIFCDVAQRPWAHGLRGNLTQATESWMKPECSLFERHSGRRQPVTSGRACVLAYFLEKLTDAR
jgi:hypothetical protein